MRMVGLAAVIAAVSFAGVQPVMATAPAKASGGAAKMKVTTRFSTPYANFLVGRYAMTMGDIDTAANALTSASLSDPNDVDLREKAFLVAILNGNIDQATRLAPAGKVSNTTQLMTGLVTAANAVKAGKGAVALKAIDTVAKIDGNERSTILLRPYIQAMNGQWKAALDDSGDEALNKDDRGRLLVYLLKAERARLYEIKGEAANADALYASLYQPGAASFIFGPDYAGFLERQGRKEDARAVWKAIADASPDPAALQALSRMDQSGYRASALPTLKLSMAQALLMSATVYSSDHDTEMSLANLRLSLYLDDTSDRARIFLGQVQQELKDSASAEAAWASVPSTSAYANEAALRRVWSLRGRDQDDEAMALVDEALLRAPDDIGFTVEKADILHDQGRDTEALKAIADRIARKGEADFTWQAWFTQAVAFDALNRWPEAEAAIKKAQGVGGDRPEILNFLGYGWIDRELHVKEGMDLIRQAMSLNPRSSAIVDSLGWGYYKLGQYEQALSYVEQAVQMSPSDAEINEHLGDVYKALGRDAEARYEWQRVLTLNASAKETASVKAKLDAPAVASGLVVPVVAPKAETTAFNDKEPAKSKTGH